MIWQIRLTIRAKLFLTLLFVCAVALTGAQMFVQWSFRQGLLELADARQQERIVHLQERLIDLYRRERSWTPLAKNGRLWLATLFGWRALPAGHEAERLRLARHRAWLRHLKDAPGVWPPQAASPAHRERPLRLELRSMLLDAEGRLVYGRPQLLADSRRYPLLLDGKQIGTLALLPGAPVPEAAELRFRASLGQRLWMIALAMLLLSGTLAYLLARWLARPIRDFQDVARRLASGDFSARVPLHGDDEIARLGRDINALATALETHEQSRRRWVADISHELRTPLALLRAELEALQDGVRPLNRPALDRLHGDALRLNRLVDDLDELSTTDPGAFGYRFADTDVAALLAADVAAFRGPFQNAGLRLALHNELSQPLLLRADAQRLSQLVRNLIRNSLQYTDAGGGLTIRLTRAAERLQIDFQDSAPGVPAHALPQLFERLYRVDASRSRHTGGAGLGLAIARNVAEAHGGSIAAAAAPSGGLWIGVTLPI